MKLMIMWIIIISAASSYADGQSKDTRNKKIEQEFLRLHQSEDEAEAKKDIVALDRLFGDDFIFVAANGDVFDKKKFLEDIKNDTEPAAQQTISYDNFKARLYGKTAVVNYLLVVKGRSNEGKDYTNRYRTSVIWVKREGNWRIINFQATRVRP